MHTRPFDSVFIAVYIQVMHFARQLSKTGCRYNVTLKRVLVATVALEKL